MPRIGPAPDVLVAVDDDVGEPVFVGVPVGAELVDAGAEGDALFDGGVSVGVGDRRALVVGLAERVAVGASGAVPRIGPVW
jgi:hypothetical protein